MGAGLAAVYGRGDVDGDQALSTDAVRVRMRSMNWEFELQAALRQSK